MTHKIEHILIFLALIGVIVVLHASYSRLYNMELTSKEALKIEKQAHIKDIYSDYKSNIDSCKATALEMKKDQLFIDQNCIKPLNDSILGKWLTEWGYGDLLITK